jgi:hypothetical protein
MNFDSEFTTNVSPSCQLARNSATRARFLMIDEASAACGAEMCPVASRALAREGARPPLSGGVSRRDPVRRQPRMQGAAPVLGARPQTRTNTASSDRRQSHHAAGHVDARARALPHVMHSRERRRHVTTHAGAM